MLYILLGEIFKERYILEKRFIIIINLNIYINTIIRFLFGCLVPLGFIKSLTVAIIN